MRTIELLRLLFDPRGRIDRKGLLAVAAPMVVIQILVMALLRVVEPTPTVEILELVTKSVFVLIALVLAAKRLHDVSMSGWWIVGTMLGVTALITASAFGFLFALGPQTLAEGNLGFVVTIGINVVLMMSALLWLHCKRGTPADNVHGPVPQGFGVSYPEDLSKSSFQTSAQTGDAAHDIGAEPATA